MTDEEARCIIDRRLAEWSKNLIQHHATPLLLVGMGHDHKKGQLSLSTLNEDQLSPNVLAAILENAARMLRKRARKRNR